MTLFRAVGMMVSVFPLFLGGVAAADPVSESAVRALDSAQAAMGALQPGAACASGAAATSGATFATAQLVSGQSTVASGAVPTAVSCEAVSAASCEIRARPLWMGDAYDVYMGGALADDTARTFEGALSTIETLRQAGLCQVPASACTINRVVAANPFGFTREVFAIKMGAQTAAAAGSFEEAASLVGRLQAAGVCQRSVSCSYRRERRDNGFGYVTWQTNFYMGDTLAGSFDGLRSAQEATRGHIPELCPGHAKLCRFRRIGPTTETARGFSVYIGSGRAFGSSSYDDARAALDALSSAGLCQSAAAGQEALAAQTVQVAVGDSVTIPAGTRAIVACGQVNLPQAPPECSVTREAADRFVVRSGEDTLVRDETLEGAAAYVAQFRSLGVCR